MEGDRWPKRLVPSQRSDSESTRQIPPSRSALLMAVLLLLVGHILVGPLPTPTPPPSYPLLARAIMNEVIKSR